MMEWLDTTSKNIGMSAYASDNMEGSSTRILVRQVVEGREVFPCSDNNSGSRLCGTSSSLSPRSFIHKSDVCISEACIKVRSPDLLFVSRKCQSF